MFNFWQKADYLISVLFLAHLAIRKHIFSKMPVLKFSGGRKLSPNSAFLIPIYLNTHWPGKNVWNRLLIGFHETFLISCQKFYTHCSIDHNFTDGRVVCDRLSSIRGSCVHLNRSKSLVEHPFQFF